MITFILYNCGLELLDSLPPKLLAQPAIKNDLKRRKKKSSEILLDLAVHQSALNSREQSNRGRLDIIHHCILQYLFSPLIHPSGENKIKQELKMFIHSINNTYFEILPEWRPPSHFIRFRGLMEQLYAKGEIIISSEEKIKLKKGTLIDLINNLNPNTLIVFTSHGKGSELSLHPFAEVMTKYFRSSEQFVCLIGGYQHGPPPEQLLKEFSNKKTKIVDLMLKGGRLPSWKVLNIALQGIEWNLTS